MAHACSRARKFTCFALGLALPLAGFMIWRCNRCRGRKHQTEERRDETIEESFPASDQPSSW
ncbi:MAG: hypothetical protein ACRD4O_12150 [Bryobacteraceae bacterium]